MIDIENDYIIFATEQMLANLPIQWIHCADHLRWGNRLFEVKHKSFSTEQELVDYVKNLNRMIVCKLPYYPNEYKSNGRVIPIYNSKPKKKYKNTKYILSYFDVLDV